MWVGHFSLLPVRERTNFRVLASGFLALWCGTIIWTGIHIVRSAALSQRKGLLGFTATAILIGVLIPNSAKQSVLDLIHSASKELPWEILYFWGEIAANGFHVALFIILSMVVRFAFPTIPIAIQVAHLMLFAAITEVLQYFAVGRGPEIGDWLFDVAGIVLAFTLSQLLRRDPPAETPGQGVDP